MHDWRRTLADVEITGVPPVVPDVLPCQWQFQLKDPVCQSSDARTENTKGRNLPRVIAADLHVLRSNLIIMWSSS